MVAVQVMCGRLGMVTGRGLASVIRLHYPRWILWSACLLLITANVFNIAADLGGMGEAAAMVAAVSAKIWTILFTSLIVSFLFWSSYRQVARVFKWITLVLLAYVTTAFFAHVDWRAALIATIFPRLSWSRESLSVLVGILGTTISSYLFSGKRRRRSKRSAHRAATSHSDKGRLTRNCAGRALMSSPACSPRT
jgi:NRAMP (natural resistance-associated macrophage protein)-like metal ion transporter